MSNRDPDARYEWMPQAIRFFGDQLLKQVHTALPGIVLSYDSQKSRARVQPATDLLFTDGTTQARAAILDVPVLHQCSRRYLLHVPLEPDDPVWLMFSQRSLANFKRTLQRSAPLTEDIMSEQDAVAIPGFTPLNITPQNGLTMQTTDGTTFVSLENGSVTINAITVTINGLNVNAHTHGGVTAGGDTSGVPQ